MTQKQRHPSHDQWEAVIGLEIHVQLNTKSKLFSSAPNRFGDEPNVNITEVCTGQPGALPVLNEEAVKKAVQLGCAIDAEIQTFSSFDRKSYFYPDSPRNFQITQYEYPIMKGGKIIVEVEGEEKTFFINRAHLEDDAGTLKHFSNFAGVDYNRAGCPLIEIVSEPCMRSGKEAVAYAAALKAILQYIDASDCNMDKGSLRIDTNVSVRKKGETNLRNKIEIKNINSFSYMDIAINAEIFRQIEAYEKHPHLPMEEVIQNATYRFVPEEQKAVMMRLKESSGDYRYFPEPDLVPLILSADYIESIRNALPELPIEKERRYVQTLGISSHQAFVLTSDKKLADYFEKALINCKNPKSLSNWMIVEFGGRLKDTGDDLISLAIDPLYLSQLVNLIEEEKITGKIAKSIADEMVKNPRLSPEEIIQTNSDYQPLQDLNEIERLVDLVLARETQSILDVKNGRTKAFSFLVGQVMKLCQGKAPPNVVNDLIKRKIENS